MAHDPNKPKIHAVEVYWTTVTYRTVILLVLLLLGAGLIGWKVLHPSSFQGVLDKLTGEGKDDTPVAASNQARFINVEGRVEVRKVNSVQWVTADKNMALDKGDYIRTFSDGWARVFFADGTTYTVKPESLITVESSTAGQNPASVYISSGAVDLSTATAPAGVSFEDASASLRENSRAAVRSDPFSRQREITVSQGSGELRRGDERVTIGQHERAAFKPTDASVTKTQVLAPPEPQRPINLEPILATNPRQHVVTFEWKPVPTAAEYLVRVSTTQMFNPVVAEKRTRGTTWEHSGLEAGKYFWTVTAFDEKKTPSEPSDIFNFTLVQQGETQSMLLEVDLPKMHGNVAEITGRTEPGATVIILGQQVPRIRPDGTFQYFTPPMTKGAHKITVLVQNRRGATAQKDVTITIT
jgi:hypothetical protein